MVSEYCCLKRLSLGTFYIAALYNPGCFCSNRTDGLCAGLGQNEDIFDYQSSLDTWFSRSTFLFFANRMQRAAVTCLPYSLSWSQIIQLTVLAHALCDAWYVITPPLLWLRQHETEADMVQTGSACLFLMQPYSYNYIYASCKTCALQKKRDNLYLHVMI